MSSLQFIQIALRWYGYIVAMLLLVLGLKIVFWNSEALGNLSELLSIVFQPMNLYAWGFATIMYLIFVAAMWARMKK